MQSRLEGNAGGIGAAHSWMHLVKMQRADQSIRNKLLVARLPVMPQILSKLLALCQRDEIGVGELAKLIAHDAGMAVKVLNVANGAAYNRNNRKIGLMQALNVLGVEMTKTLVISESIFQTFNSLSPGVELEGFWAHALKTAVIARELARKMSYPHSEEAYLAGLLHDVGRLALLGTGGYGSNFMARDDEHLCSVEMSSMGMTHAEAGAWLIERWNLDSFMADSVRYHHEPIGRLKSAHPLIRLLCLAHLLSSHRTDALEGMGEICGISDEELKAILDAVEAQTRTAAAYFGISLGEAAAPAAEYSPPAKSEDKRQARLADEVRNASLVSAAAQSFSRCSGRELLETIARTACVLFNFDDTLLLLNHAKALTGVPVTENQQRISEISIPLTDESAAAESVQKRQITFIRRDDSLSIVDQQLLRSMKTEYLVYMPLIAEQSCLGVLAGGLSAPQAAELWDSERFLKAYATQAAASLKSATQLRSEIEKNIAKINKEHQEASRKVIHEVNNPLSIIKNYLVVLDDKIARNEPIVEELSVLNEEIDRVGRIVGSLASQEAEPETTEINGVLKDVVRLFSISRYLPSSVNIVVNTGEKPEEIACAADPLKQILLNLIKNAVEALPNGGTIEIRNNGRRIQDGRAYCELRISDTGTGIPAEVLANLFSPVRSSKRGENRGLGLSIIHDLVKKIGGLISCDSGPAGTTFTVLLPSAIAKAENPKYAAAQS